MLNDYFLLLIVIALVILSVFKIFFKRKQTKQLQYINNYIFPERIKIKLKEQYPHLNEEKLNKVIFALRDYFIIANKANGKTVAMPSKVVDLAWHEFILSTREYQKFSQNAFGKFFHHTPTEPIQNIDCIDDSLRLTWKLACLKENIIPTAPEKLPLLFAIDKQLKIEDGNIYTLGNNLTNTLSSHRYNCSGGCGGASCSGTSGCGGGCGGG